MIQIKNRKTVNVIFEHHGTTMKDAVEAAVVHGVSLTDANLTDANLAGAKFGDVPVIENIHQAVYNAASQTNALNMESWHCGTTHCRAGWVVTLAGEAGVELENKIGTPAAAMAIYLASDKNRFTESGENPPNFYCENSEALADMKRLADLEAKGY